jgi:PAS domain S-box-containing protein
MAEQSEMLRRQQALAKFGDFVLDHDDLDDILTEACRLIAKALDADLAKVVEIDHISETGLIRAGVGWDSGIIGCERIGLGDRSSEAYAVETSEPVITNDIEEERRFKFAPFLRAHGVVALVNVPILLPGRCPWGVLQVDAREVREFTQDDIDFLKTYAMVLGPVIDRLRVAAEREQARTGLAEREGRFRLLVESVRDYAIFTTDRDGAITSWPAGAAAVFGWSEAEMLGKSIDLTFLPEDVAGGEPEKERRTATLEGCAPNVRWHIRKDGSHIFINGSIQPFLRSDGQIREFIKIGQDVTERRHWEERQQVLVGELQHRTRNLIAVVRSMAEKTLRRSNDLADFQQAFRDRLEALARVQGLLSRLEEHDRVTFDTLIRTELMALGVMESSSERLSLHGPEGVRLRSSTVQTLAMALHELATNAAKYGALSRSGGHLAITWRLSGERLHIDWMESGVTMPPPGSPPSGTGQGRELIERALPYQLQAETKYELRQDGVRCAISIPVSISN